MGQSRCCIQAPHIPPPRKLYQQHRASWKRYISVETLDTSLAGRVVSLTLVNPCRVKHPSPCESCVCPCPPTAGVEGGNLADRTGAHLCRHHHCDPLVTRSRFSKHAPDSLPQATSDAGVADHGGCVRARRPTVCHGSVPHRQVLPLPEEAGTCQAVLPQIPAGDPPPSPGQHHDFNCYIQFSTFNAAFSR